MELDILKLNRAYHRGENNYFDNAEKFIQHVLPGIYLKTDFGDGTILYVDRVDLQMQFKFYYTDEKTGVALKKKVTDKNGKAGTDSIGYGWTTAFASTKEVIQANKFSSENNEKIEALIKDKSCTYIKSPAGIFTQATLPYDQIYEELKNDTLNAVKLTFTNYHQEDKYDFSMRAPNNVLLIRVKDYEKFFSENELPNNITSFVATHNSAGTNQYTFNNLARLVTTCINEKNAAKAKAKEEAGSNWNESEWENNWKADKKSQDWNKVYLIPVRLAYDSSSKNAQLINIQHDLQPTYAKLEGGEDKPLNLSVTYTRFNQE
ncbi:lipoprotein [gut metagenome]|uniref:Lipoprotein n=1 Tax=gut metagenome TaxID=749906 RepID=J9GFK1_9ZZZZ